MLKLPHNCIQAEFRRGGGTRGKISNIRCIIEKAREFQKKTSTSALLITPKPLTGSQQTVVNSSGDGNTRPLASWELCMQVKKEHLEPDKEK